MTDSHTNNTLAPESPRLAKPPSLLELWETLLAKLANLVRVSEDGGFSVETFSEVEKHLDSVPLAHLEYWLARRRLQNAKRYLHRGETGAARFELRLLVCSLNGMAQQWAPIHQRRLCPVPNSSRRHLPWIPRPDEPT